MTLWKSIKRLSATALGARFSCLVIHANSGTMVHSATPTDAGTLGVSNLPRRSGIGGCAAQTVSIANRTASSLEKICLRSSSARCCRTRKRLSIDKDNLSRNKYRLISGSEISDILFFFKKIPSFLCRLFGRKLDTMDIKHQSVILRRSDGTWGLGMQSRSKSKESSKKLSAAAGVSQSQTSKAKKRAGAKKRKKNIDEQGEVADKPKARKKVKQPKKAEKKKKKKPSTAVSRTKPKPAGPPRVIRKRKRKAKEAAMVKISVGASVAAVKPPKARVGAKPAEKVKPRMQSVSANTTPEILHMEGSLVPSETTVEAETQNLNRNSSATGFDGWLEAEIRQILQDSTQEQFCLETDACVDQLREDLPRFTRKEEDAMLVEVSPRSSYVCEMGRSCESIKMSKHKGVSPPIILGAVRKEGFSDYKQCLLCLRNTATSTLLRLRMDRVGMVRDGCLQTHANYCNINGEYRMIDCLPVRRDRFEGLVLPIIAHRESGFRAKESRHLDGTKRRFWCQKEGYPYPNMSMPAITDAGAALPQARATDEEKSDEGSFLSREPQTKAMN